MEIIIIIVLLTFGIVFLLAEIFLFPGISIAGIAGAIFFIGGIIYAFTVGTMHGFITTAISVVALGISVYYFMKSKTLDKLSLHTEIDGTVDTIDSDKIKVGDKGIANSRLAPMGKVKINGITTEAKSLFEFIDEGSEVEVVAVNKTNVEVKPIIS
jgi:membrane-bound ClpP family serine protease